MGSRAKQLLERNENEALGKHVSLFFATKVSRFPTKDHLAALREGREQRIQLRMKRGPGKFFDGVLCLAKPSDSDATRIDCQASIVAERQRAVGALRRSEERLRYALEAASHGLWDWNFRTDNVVFSPRVSEILGQESRSEGVRATNVAAWDSRVHPEDDLERRRALQRHFDGYTSAYEFEYRLRTERGKWKWVVVRGRVTERDSAGAPLRMSGTITDISERKFAQEALKRSEEQYRNLFEHASDAVLLFDHETGKIRDANEKAEQLLGYSSPDFKKMAIRDLHPEDQWQRVESALERSQAGIGSPFEVDGLTSKGKHVPLEINTRLVNYGGQQVYQSFIRDISQRLALEQQLRQSQKMETVGRLAGGVAHDFNNVLTAIQGYTALLQSALSKGSEELELTEEVFNAVQRASRLTKQLLTFSRQDILHPACVA